MQEPANALIFERCLAAIGARRLGEAERLLREIDLSAAGPVSRALHAKLWDLAALPRSTAPEPCKANARPPPATAPFPSPHISLASSVFNRFWQLRETLPRNLDTIRGEADIELVVVDFGGHDSAEIMDFIEREFAFDLLSGQLKYFVANVPWTRFHMAAAKNVAHRLSRGAFIFSLDIDNLFLPEDLAVVREHARLHPHALLHQTTGPAPMRHATWARYGVLASNDDYHLEPPAWDGGSGRVGVGREAFERVNGYNENLTGMGMDDIDFMLRSMKAGVQYRHVRIDRPIERIFIDNGSADPAHEHAENRNNWVLMDEGLQHGRLAPLYTPCAPVEHFRSHVPPCVARSAKSRVTLFASLFSVQDHLARFLDDLYAVTATPGICVWLLDVVGSHPEPASQRLAAAADGRCVFYVPVRRDPGLYALWNVAIRAIGSPYLANFNADDLRGGGWLPECLRVLESGQADVASPVTVPFKNAAATSYSEAVSALRAAAESVPRWFETRCLVEGDYPNESTRHEPLLDGIYSQQDLFQLMSGDRLDSYSIPNASPVWSRRVHQLAGYFDEKTWGTFADLALWAEAGARGARFRQVPYWSLFHISDQQAHRRQARDDKRLVQLALRHGAPGLRAWVARRQFDLSQASANRCSNRFTSWHRVCDMVGRHFVHATPRLMLDMSVTRSQLANPHPDAQQRIGGRPWLGFVHAMPGDDIAWNAQESHLDMLLDDPRFATALPLCRGLVALDERDRAYLVRRLEHLRDPPPVYTLFYPLEAASAFKEPSETREPLNLQVFHLAQQPGSLARFARLRLHRSQKTLLLPRAVAGPHFVREVVDKTLRLANLGPAGEHFGRILSVSPADLAHVVHRGVVFADCMDPTGTGLVAECISAAARLVINRHPAFLEYLGADYPLFYVSDEEADAKVELALSPTFDATLRDHQSTIQSRWSIDRFCRDLSRIGEQVYDTL